MQSERPWDEVLDRTDVKRLGSLSAALSYAVCLGQRSYKLDVHAKLILEQLRRLSDLWHASNKPQRKQVVKGCFLVRGEPLSLVIITYSPSLHDLSRTKYLPCSLSLWPRT